MAIEDAAALGIIFSREHFNGDIAEALAVYQEVRLPRVTRVQSAAAKAAYNINERIGEFSLSSTYSLGFQLLIRQDSRPTPTRRRTG